MRGAVQAHQAVAALPINLCAHALANLQRWRIGCGHMHYQRQRLAVFGLAFARIDHRHHTAIGAAQFASIAGLPAAQRVEHGAVEHDAGLAHGQYGGFTGLQIGVGAEQFFGSGQGGHGRRATAETHGRQSC